MNLLDVQFLSSMPAAPLFLKPPVESLTATADTPLQFRSSTTALRVPVRDLKKSVDLLDQRIAPQQPVENKSILCITLAFLDEAAWSQTSFPPTRRRLLFSKKPVNLAFKASLVRLDVGDALLDSFLVRLNFSDFSAQVIDASLDPDLVRLQASDVNGQPAHESQQGPNHNNRHWMAEQVAPASSSRFPALPPFLPPSEVRVLRGLSTTIESRFACWKSTHLSCASSR